MLSLIEDRKFNRLGFRTSELPVELFRFLTLDSVTQGGGFRVQIETHSLLNPSLCTRGMVNQEAALV